MKAHFSAAVFYEPSGKQIPDLRGRGAGRGEGLQGRPATSSSAGPGPGLGGLGVSSFFKGCCHKHPGSITLDQSANIDCVIAARELQPVEQKMRANLAVSGSF